MLYCARHKLNPVFPPRPPHQAAWSMKTPCLCPTCLAQATAGCRPRLACWRAHSAVRAEGGLSHSCTRRPWCSEIEGRHQWAAPKSCPLTLPSLLCTLMHLQTRCSTVRPPALRPYHHPPAQCLPSGPSRGLPRQRPPCGRLPLCTPRPALLPGQHPPPSHSCCK